MNWYYTVNGTVNGPVSRTQIVEMVQHRTVSKGTLVWSQGMKNWETLEKVGTREGWDFTPYHVTQNLIP